MYKYIKLIHLAVLTMLAEWRYVWVECGVHAIAADSFTTPWSERNTQVARIQAGFSGMLNVVLPKT